MTPSTELAEAVDTYRQIHRENVARFEVTPVRQFLKRQRRYEACRDSYASLIGVGESARMPLKATGAMKSRFVVAWNRWIGESIAIAAIFLVPAAIIWGMIHFIDGPRDPKDHPLPAGITQNGTTFTVSADYLRKPKSDELDPEYHLCHRLPGGDYEWDLDEARITDGQMRVTCKRDD